MPVTDLNRVHLTVLGWIVLLVMLALVNKSKEGHTLIFYGLVIILTFLLIFNYRRVTGLLIRRDA